MKRMQHRTLSVILLALLAIPICAQKEVEALVVGDSLCVDSTAMSPFRLLMQRTGRQVKSVVRNLDRYDTDYIEPNYYEWTAMLQNTNFFQIIGISARDDNGHRQTIDFAPKPSYKIGPYIGWRWIFLGYTIDASRPQRAGKKTEFNLSIYSNKIGGDIVYLKNSQSFTMRSVYGFEDIERNQFKGTSFNGLSTHTLSLNAYYVFNNKKFSYPAAYNQSTVQKRSAGSLIMGFRYDYQHINFDYQQLPSVLRSEDVLSEEMKFHTLIYSSYCLNVGYAYNWVVARNCLVAVSLTPAIGVKRLSGEKLTGKKVLNNMKRINFDFLGRLGFVWNTHHRFAGFSLVSHLYDYRRDHFSVANSVNYLNFYAGFYFGPKKRYLQHTTARHRKTNP